MLPIGYTKAVKVVAGIRVIKTKQNNKKIQHPLPILQFRLRALLLVLHGTATHRGMFPVLCSKKGRSVVVKHFFFDLPLLCLESAE